MWDMDTGERVSAFASLVPDSANASATLFDFSFSNDRRTLATVGSDEIFRVWDIASGTLQSEFDRSGNNPFAVTLSHDGKLLVAGLGTGVIELWELATGKNLPRRFQDHGQAIYRLRLSPDGKTPCVRELGHANAYLPNGRWQRGPVARRPQHPCSRGCFPSQRNRPRNVQQ